MRTLSRVSPYSRAAIAPSNTWGEEHREPWSCHTKLKYKKNNDPGDKFSFFQAHQHHPARTSVACDTRQRVTLATVNSHIFSAHDRFFVHQVLRTLLWHDLSNIGASIAPPHVLTWFADHAQEGSQSGHPHRFLVASAVVALERVQSI